MAAITRYNPASGVMPLRDAMDRLFQEAFTWPSMWDRPTGGTARFANGLSAIDFLRRSSLLQFTANGLAELAPDVRVLAEKEGLTGHAASVEIRLDG